MQSREGRKKLGRVGGVAAEIGEEPGAELADVVAVALLQVER